MNKKSNILQCLIENQAFAPSASALAKELGYKGKMTLYRLIKGQATERTVDEVWARILDCYLLSDTDLYDSARIFEATRYCCDKLLPEIKTGHPEQIEQLTTAFVYDVYDYFSPEFQQENAPFLKDLRKDEPDVFWGIVTLIYIRFKKIDLYRKDREQAYCKLIDGLDELLFTLYPEKADAHEVSYNLKNLATDPNLWRAIADCTILFRRYTEADFTKEASKSMMLFNWEERSFWHTPYCPYRQGSEVWLLTEQNTGRARNGYYMVLRLEAGRDTHTFKLTDALVFCFWTIDNENDPPILQACRGAGSGREWCFYAYEYNEKERCLSFEPNPETGNIFGLPDSLQRIDLEHPSGKDEKVWARILKMWEEEQGPAIFRKAKEWLSDRIELEEEYKLTDVQISRANLTLSVGRNGKDIQYELPIEAYDFLSEISPFQPVLIVKHIDDNQVYVEWPEEGYSIRLSEFTEKEL